MTMLSKQRELDVEATEAFAHLFQALADPSRLSVLQHLSLGEHRVRDLVDHLGLAQSTVSKHIAFLAACRLVRARVDGRSTWYALAHSRPLGDLVAAAERLLETTGSQHALCAHLTARADDLGMTGEDAADGSRA
ncbi:ArsR/SmtB family transcription factor [Agrococcus sp. Ld7]|uniref:ArsR/SmtB family transcription factor n=1 Tax=Agrococcus sp. Ld7 TaxID=649148 RepID=UPI00386B32E3